MIKMLDKLGDDEFMRGSSPHPYYGTLYEAMDLNLLDQYMSIEEINFLLRQLQSNKEYREEEHE